MLKLFHKEESVISISRYETAKGKRYCVKSGNHTKRGFKTKKEAKDYEKYLKGELLREKFESDNKPKRPVVLFQTIAEDYIEMAFNESDITFGTNQKKQEILKYAILPNVPNKDINRFTERDCVIFRKKVKDLDYSTSHKNDILNEFKAIFKHAIKYYKLDKNPTYVLEPFKKTFEEKMAKKKKDERIWTDEEFNKFIKYVDNESYKAFYIVLFYTGVRLGEAQALKWKDLDGDILHIYKSLSKSGGDYFMCESNPKTASSVRDIELGPELGLYLRNYKQKLMDKNEDFSDDWYMFGGRRYISRTSATRHKDIAVEKAEVPRMTLHDFRHAHASNLIAKGVNIVSVSRRLGHSSVTITLDVYTHRLGKNDPDLINKLGFKNY